MRAITKIPVRKSQSREEHQHLSSFHLGEIIDQLCKSEGATTQQKLGDQNPPLPVPSYPAFPSPFITIPFPSLLSLSLPPDRQINKFRAEFPLNVGPIAARGLGSPAAKRMLAYFRHKFALFDYLMTNNFLC